MNCTSSVHVNRTVLLEDSGGVLFLVVEGNIDADLLQDLDLLFRPSRPDDLDVRVDDLSVLAYETAFLGVRWLHLMRFDTGLTFRRAQRQQRQTESWPKHKGISVDVHGGDTKSTKRVNAYLFRLLLRKGVVGGKGTLSRQSKRSSVNASRYLLWPLDHLQIAEVVTTLRRWGPEGVFLEVFQFGYQFIC